MSNQTIMNIPDKHDSLINVKPFRNTISPYSNISTVKKSDPGTLWVDTCYGYAYDFHLEPGFALYGNSETMPIPFSDSLKVTNCLRVPFRQIPCVTVEGVRELESVVSHIKTTYRNLPILFRGQNRQYLQQRKEDEVRALYGNDAAIEPSISSSISRKSIDITDVMPEWMSMLQLYFHFYNSRLKRWATKSQLDDFNKSWTQTVFSYDFYLLSLSIAQHYGLGSVGIDLTTDLATAVYFALTKFVGTGQHLKASPLEQTDSFPVLYVFVFEEGEFLDYSEHRPRLFPASRPDAQAAKFMLTGWGLSRNDVARWLALAVYLNFNYSSAVSFLPKTEALFPSAIPYEDDLAYFISRISRSAGSHQFQKFLSGFYTASS